jgi:hypothetical protein
MSHKKPQLDELDQGWDLPPQPIAHVNTNKIAKQSDGHTIKEITGYHRRVMESLPIGEKDTITGVNAMLHPLGELILMRLRKMKDEIQKAPKHIPRRNIVAFHKDRLLLEIETLCNRMREHFPRIEFPQKTYNDCKLYISGCRFESDSDFQNIISNVLLSLYPEMSRSSNFFESL